VNLRAHFLWLIILVFGFKTLGQTVFYIENYREIIPAGENAYLAGSMNGWKPNVENYRFKNGFLTLAIPEKVEFKLTLGSWDRVETDTKGNDIGNRSYAPSGKRDTVRLKVAAWKTPGASQAAIVPPKGVTIIRDFEMPELGRKRDIWIYLPPSYDSTDLRYPVLYMQDGQNLFDAKAAFSGEWEVDETLNRLSKEYNFEIIVIGIAHGDAKRMTEYAPWKNAKHGGGEGEAYCDFLVNTLMPYVDAHYRTKTEPYHTGIMGSSLGANISLYAGLMYPEVFSRVGAMSPAFWYNPELFNLDKSNPNPQIGKLYMNAGTKEPESVAEDMNRMAKALKSKGVFASAIRTNFSEGQEHNEANWRSIFAESVLWLFDWEDRIQASSGNTYRVSIQGNECLVFSDSKIKKGTYAAFNIVGQPIGSGNVEIGKKVILENAPQGFKIVVFQFGVDQMMVGGR
jgi:predicted alpha/beta superfamily hydrolase